MADVPANVFICRAGHVTEANDWDKRTAYPFDYQRQCRRNVWREVPMVDIGDGTYEVSLTEHEVDTESGVQVVGGKAMASVRCKSPVVQARKHPELYSAFLLGGEDAVAAVVLDVIDADHPSD